MNLDDLTYSKQLDAQNMLGEIDNLPDQLAPVNTPAHSASAMS